MICRHDYIAVGEITGPHGSHGEIKVLPLTDFPERWGLLSQAEVQVGEKFFVCHIVGVRPFRGGVLLKLREIDDPETAASLRRGLICIPRTEAMPLPEGTYYIFDLIGLAVYTMDGGYLGELQEVLSLPANDVYVVKAPPPGKEILLPAIKDVIKEISLEKRIMRVDPLPGLLD